MERELVLCQRDFGEMSRTCVAIWDKARNLPLADFPFLNSRPARIMGEALKIRCANLIRQDECWDLIERLRQGAN